MRGLTPGGEPTASASGNAHYPLLYVYPSLDRDRVLGLDLSSLPSRLSAMKRAVARGGVATTERVSPGYESGRSSGHVAFRAVYEGTKEPASADLRRKRVLGFVLVAFRQMDVLQAALKGSRADPQIDVSLALRPVPPAKSSPLGSTTVFEALGRSWHVTCRPTEEFWRRHRPWALVSVLAGCLICGGLVLGYVSRSSRRREFIERLIRRRTAELRDSERRFRDIADCASDWFWEIDEQARFRYCSNSIHQVVGYDPEELLGRTPPPRATSGGPDWG